MKDKLKRYGPVIIVLIVLIGAGWFVSTRGPMAPAVVEVAGAKNGDLQPEVYGVGTVEARRLHVIGPIQAGRLLSVLVDQGDMVKAGQILAKIDPVDLEQRINSAEMARQRSESAMLIASAQMREAASRNELALVSAKRYSELEANQAISKETMDIKLNEATVAQAALESAQFALQAAKQDMGKAASEYEALLKQRDNLTLTAPTDGIIVTRDSEPGNTVVAGQTVLRMVEPESLWISSRVDQSRSMGIAVGQAALITLRSHQDTNIPGSVQRIEIQSDSVTEERIVNVAFNSPPAGLSLGELAEVTISLPPVTNALIVPSASIKSENGQYGVWQVIEGKARFRPVKVGAQTLDGQTQIIDGLKAGEQVIVYSTVELRDGLRVRVGGK
jgi:HlyD family secretion protein